MMNAYDELLEAAVQYLKDLKAQGVAYVNVRPETLNALTSRSANRRLSASPAAPKVEKRPPSAAPVVVAPTQEPLLAEAAPPVAAVVTLTPEAKLAAMNELRERALGCQKCPHLVSSRKNVVFGVGDINSPLMFVGEAPGGDEDVQGEPFVGKAGQLLTRIIQTMGFPRQSVYIANILKCRPDTPGQTSGNRRPTPEEMKTCLPYLLAQIDLIRPRILVALGATAMEGLFGKTIGITKIRGHFQEFRGIPVMPTYHPSYLLRNQSLSMKREVWEDMLQVLEKLNLPISEKQRNYFLKST